MFKPITTGYLKLPPGIDFIECGSVVEQPDGSLAIAVNYRPATSNEKHTININQSVSIAETVDGLTYATTTTVVADENDDSLPFCSETADVLVWFHAAHAVHVSNTQKFLPHLTPPATTPTKTKFPEDQGKKQLYEAAYAKCFYAQFNDYFTVTDAKMASEEAAEYAIFAKNDLIILSAAIDVMVANTTTGSSPLAYTAALVAATQAFDELQATCLQLEKKLKTACDDHVIVAGEAAAAAHEMAKTKLATDQPSGISG